MIIIKKIYNNFLIKAKAEQTLNEKTLIINDDLYNVFIDFSFF